MRSLAAVIVVLTVGVVGICRADVVQLNNGDSFRGKVVALDEKHLRLQSESLGELSLDRAKIAAIYFGDRPAPTPPATPPSPAPAAQTPAPATPRSPEEILGMLQAGPSAGTPQDAVQQLQKEGVGKGTISELQKNFPLLLTPEVQGYFNDKLQGLMTGKLDIQDIRKEAIHARDEIDQLQKELGPEASALNPYRSILDKFILESTPPTESSQPPAATTPPKN